jgi:hypothetical protein
MSSESSEDIPEQEILNLQEEVTIAAVHLRRLGRALEAACEGLAALGRAIDALPRETLKAIVREASEADD